MGRWAASPKQIIGPTYQCALAVYPPDLLRPVRCTRCGAFTCRSSERSDRAVSVPDRRSVHVSQQQLTNFEHGGFFAPEEEMRPCGDNVAWVNLRQVRLWPPRQGGEGAPPMRGQFVAQPRFNVGAPLQCDALATVTLPTHAPRVRRFTHDPSERPSKMRLIAKTIMTSDFRQTHRVVCQIALCGGDALFQSPLMRRSSDLLSECMEKIGLRHLHRCSDLVYRQIA